MATEAAVLAHVMNKTRALTNIYLNFLKDVDAYKVFELEGKQLNSIFWIMAHLSVTENFLLLRSTGGEIIKIGWARQFGLGSVPVSREDSPPMDEITGMLQLVHEKSIQHISGLDDAFLDQDNTTGFEFAGEKSVRSIIIHAARHEAAHAGHLGWLCKLHGIKTI
ncbi:MAG: DinB family protein [Bacteroidetes bacterium]|nr:DinB family protein [Bacteroidota bacterium]